MPTRAPLTLGLLLCFSASVCSAQTTTVTGTVKDLNGVAYAGARLKAQLVLTGAGVNGQPTVTVNNAQQCASAGKGSAPCQMPFQGTVGPITLDSGGNISSGGLNLQDNSLVTPAGTQWLFSITSQGEPPPIGTGPQACFATITITGAGQSISSSLSLCPALSAAGVNVPASFPPSGTTGTVLTYKTSDGTWHFTRVDGSFQNAVCFDNALTPGFPLTDDYSCDSMNSDGQRNLATYHWNGSAYIVSSIIDLDQDGHIALAGGNGGGFSTDQNTGNSCIPATTSPITFVAQATCWNQSGQETKSVGVSLQGIGHGSIVFRGAATRATNLAFTFSPINGGSNTTSAACPGAVGNCPGSVGMYELTELFTVTAAGTGSPTILVTVTYTDDVQAQTNAPCLMYGPSGVTTTAQAIGTVGNTVTAKCWFYAAANTNITVNWTFGGTTNSTVSGKTYLVSDGI